MEMQSQDIKNASWVTASFAFGGALCAAVTAPVSVPLFTGVGALAGLGVWGTHKLVQGISATRKEVVEATALVGKKFIARADSVTEETITKVSAWEVVALSAVTGVLSTALAIISDDFIRAHCYSVFADFSCFRSTVVATVCSGTTVVIVVKTGDFVLNRLKRQQVKESWRDARACLKTRAEIAEIEPQKAVRVPARARIEQKRNTPHLKSS